MQVVHLPIVPDYTPLDVVLRAMRIQQRSAVLRESSLSVDLVEVPDLFSGLMHQVTALSGIKDFKPVHRLSPLDISQWNLDVKDPDRTGPSFELLLDAVQRSYVLIDAFFGTALMVTRHEGLAGQIEAVPRQCQCEGPLRHGFPHPHMSDGDSCDSCGFTVKCF